MSWHDPARSSEPESETAIRNELRGLLGIPAQPLNYFENDPSPELILLADDLRREAQRRKHTARRQSSWLLLAAALPFTLALAGVGVWGIAQKHKADRLTAAVVHQEAEIQQLAAAQQHQVPQSPAADAQQLRVQGPQPKGQQPRALLMGQASPKGRPKELVIPVQRSPDFNPNNNESVKTH